VTAPLRRTPRCRRGERSLNTRTAVITGRSSSGRKAPALWTHSQQLDNGLRRRSHLAVLSVDVISRVLQQLSIDAGDRLAAYKRTREVVAARLEIDPAAFDIELIEA
jgi:hypothetical protein